MKLSWLPYALAFLFWIIFTTWKTSWDNLDGFYMAWYVGPYVVIGAFFISISIAIHFLYYNSKKILAQTVARLYYASDEIIYNNNVAQS